MALLATATLASSASSDGIVRLSWDSCPRAVVTHQEVYENGSSLVQLSVSGVSVPHRGYRTIVELRAADGTLADAWRFDQGGCPPADAFTAYPETPFFSKCRSFARGLYTTQRSYQVLSSRDAARMMLDVEMSEPFTPVPEEQFFLASFFFEHFMGRYGDVEPPYCGGLDEPVCFRIVEARLREANGTWSDFTWDPTGLTAAGATIPPSPCDAVPARASTWGALKRQYRR